ncbi:MAG: hypothetical protein JOY65_12090 [Acetobacteraceae bacterium]|nr:hypothetical protein [Acetobacteraceae bacterium]
MRRRAVLRGVAAVTGFGAPAARGETMSVRSEQIIVSALPASAVSGAAPPLFQAAAFNTVGVFDIDWLLDPRFTRLLDTMAASPQAFGGVRFFGALNSGERENVFPKGSGGVWRSPDEQIDLSVTLRALAELTSRHLVPFVGLTFFPAAVSPSPIQPPPTFERWQTLVRTLLDQCVARFGAPEVGRWWFEVWNEPNMPPFWSGSFEEYLALYRATSEAVLSAGHAVRLGGPAVAYTPDEGARLIERFLAFLHREPAVKCDFVSLHRKGIWVSRETRPELARSVDAARETARAATRIDPDRFRGLWVVNDEADMKVGFDTPYEPRMTEQFPSWLAAQAIAYDRLSTEHASSGLLFAAFSDNANQQLIRAPFDGRRSVTTRLGAPDDLAKVPAYNFYELLRLLGDRRATVRTPDAAYPNTDLYHLASATPAAIASLLTVYPTSGEAEPGERRIEYLLRDVPWERVNVAEFRIDGTLSNAFAAVSRAMPAGNIDTDAARRIRFAQELAVAAPIQSGVTLAGGELRREITLRAFATALLWVTPFRPDVPERPAWLRAEVERATVVLRWPPNREPWFYTYEVVRRSARSEKAAAAPIPLRASFWVDTPPPGEHVYAVRAVSASGVRGESVSSPPVRV